MTCGIFSGAFSFSSLTKSTRKSTSRKAKKPLRRKKANGHEKATKRDVGLRQLDQLELLVDSFEIWIAHDHLQKKKNDTAEK